MASEEVLKTIEDKRSMVVVGDLPDDFLRITFPKGDTNSMPTCYGPPSERWTDQYLNSCIRLNITVVQAQLTKNYGLTRMDPYCKLNIGGVFFQTATAINGAKNPVWNKIIILLLAPEINEFDLEIYDEKSFTPDTRFAWTRVKIPERVYHGDDQNHWYPLSGLTGVDAEGQINILFTLLSPSPEALVLKAPFMTLSPVLQPDNLLFQQPQQPLPPPQQQPQQPPPQQLNSNTVKDQSPSNKNDQQLQQQLDPAASLDQVTINETTKSATNHPQKQQQQQQDNKQTDELHLMDVRINDDDDDDDDNDVAVVGGADDDEVKRKVAVLKEMFKDTSDDVILLVLDGNHGDIDASINALLEMQST